MRFKKNVGGNDSILRVIVGVTLLSAYLLNSKGEYTSWLFLGIIPLVTGLMSRCPFYMLFGLCTIDESGDRED